VRLFRWRRQEPRLRPLDEAECYGRSYGQRTEQVRTLKLEPRRPRYAGLATGEELRRRFQERLDARDPTQE